MVLYVITVAIRNEHKLSQSSQKMTETLDACSILGFKFQFLQQFQKLFL